MHCLDHRRWPADPCFRTMRVIATPPVWCSSGLRKGANQRRKHDIKFEEDNWESPTPARLT